MAEHTSYNIDERWIIGRDTTFKVMDNSTRTEIHLYDDPTGGARLKYLSALNSWEVQQHPERRDKCT